MNAICLKCCLEWEPDDNGNPGPCPNCGKYDTTPVACETCPVAELSMVRNTTAAGRLFERVLSIEADMSHFTVPWDQVTADEAKGVAMLRQERAKFQNEEHEVDEERRRQENAVRGR